MADVVCPGSAACRVRRLRGLVALVIEAAVVIALPAVIGDRRHLGV